MAKFEDIKKANDEQKRLNKSLDAAVLRVETMEKNYAKFADKRAKEAKEYKKQLDAAIKALTTINENVETQKENLDETVELYKKTLETSNNILDSETKRVEFQKENKIIAETLSGLDNSAIMASKAKEALDKGQLSTAQMRLDVADQQSAILQGIATGEMTVNDALGQHEDLSKQILENDELSSAEKEKLIEYSLSTVDQASQLNDKLSKTNSLGISQRDIMLEQQTALSEQEEMLKGLKDKAAKYIGVFSNGFLAFGAISKALASQVLSTRDLSKNLGISQGEAFKLGKQTKLLKMEFAGMGMDFVEAQSAMVDSASDLSEVTYGNVKAVGIMSERYGVSATAAANLRKIQLDITGGSEDAADALTAGAIALAEANDVAPGAILSDMAANSEEFARFGAEGAKRMALTAVATKKLGIEMSSLVSASKGLLDIENSLNAEMEAEVMLGKELNLETARAAALRGDHLTVVKELAKEFGTVEDFQNLSVLQQEAAAAAAGLTVEEMTKMLANQDKITSLKGEELEHFKKTGELAAEAIPIGQRIAGFAAENVNSIIAAVGAYGSMKQAIGDVASTAKSGMGILKKFVGMGQKGAGALKGAKGVGGGLLSKTKAVKMPKMPKTPSMKGGGKGTLSFMKGLGKIPVKSILAGAAALVVVSAAVLVFGKAVQEFSNVSWTAVAMAVVSMLALVGALALVGVIMMSGVGTVAILAGAAAILILSAALLVLAYGLAIISEAVPNLLLLIPAIPLFTLAMIPLNIMGPFLPITAGFLGIFAVGLIALGVGLAALKAGGPEGITTLAKALQVLVPIGDGLRGLGLAFTQMAAGIAVFAGSLLLLTPMLPTLIALSALGGTLAMVGGMFGLGESGSDGADGVASTGSDGQAGADGSAGPDSSSTNQELLNKFDELISIIKQGGDVKLDGRKVGETMFLGRTPAGA